MSFTRSSPEMSLGSSVSRRAARVRDSLKAVRTSLKTGRPASQTRRVGGRRQYEACTVEGGSVVIVSNTEPCLREQARPIRGRSWRSGANGVASADEGIAGLVHRHSAPSKHHPTGSRSTGNDDSECRDQLRRALLEALRRMVRSVAIEEDLRCIARHLRAGPRDVAVPVIRRSVLASLR